MDTKSRSWLQLLFISTGNIISGIYLSGFAALFPFLQEEFQLTKAQMGLHSTFFFLPSLASIFTGRIVDEKGSKWGMVFGVFALGFFVILHSIAPNYYTLLLFVALLGFFFSMNVPSASKGVAETLPPEKRSTAMGIWSMGFPLGGFFAASLLPMIGNVLGWRKTILLPGFFSLFSGLFILLFYQDKGRERGKNRKSLPKAGHPISFFQEIISLMKSAAMIKLCTLGFFFSFLNSAVSAHFAFFLYADYQVDKVLAGIIFAFINIGSIVGRPGWGIICDVFLKSNKNRGFLYLGMLFSIISLFFGHFLQYFDPPVLVFFLLSFLTGFSARGWQGLYYSSLTDMAGEQHTGFTAGASSFFLFSGSLLGPPIFGFIGDISGTYRYSWLLFGVCSFIVSIIQVYFCCFQKEKLEFTS